VRIEYRWAENQVDRLPALEEALALADDIEDGQTGFLIERALSEWRLDRDGERIGERSSRTDHCARGPVSFTGR
jgi:hypothetical protein